ncbi:MAG: hypothetical protein Q9162_000997 [Coniocarpon cinnabarinum]
MTSHDDAASIEERISRACAQVFSEVRGERLRYDEMHEREKRELLDRIQKLNEASSAQEDARVKSDVIARQRRQIQDLNDLCSRLREERDEFIQRHAELSRKHSNINKQASQYKKAAEYWETKYRQNKDKIRQWQKWERTQRFALSPQSKQSRNTEARIALGLSSPSVPRLPTPISEARGPCGVARDAFANVRSPEVEPGPDAAEAAIEVNQMPAGAQGYLDIGSKQLGIGESGELQRSKHSYPPELGFVVASSQTTEDDCSHNKQGGAQTNDECALPDSSPPQVMLERPVARRRAEVKKTRPFEADGEGTHEQPLLVKEESDGSRDAAIQAMPELRQQGTGDLDEETTIITPRKRRRLERAQNVRRANGMSHRMASNLSYDRAESLPHDMPTVEASRSNEALRISFHETIPDESKSKPLGTSTDILSPIDANQQVLPRSARSTMSKKRRLNKDSDIKQFAEDGESFGSKTRKTKHTAVAQPRLQALLEGPTSLNTHVVQSPGNTRTHHNTKAFDAASDERALYTPRGPPKSREGTANVTNKEHAVTVIDLERQALDPQSLRTPRTAPALTRCTKPDVNAAPTAPTPATLPRSRHANNPPSRPTSHYPGVPLRSLSPSRLTLADFKINPNANSNETFAYQETLRKASEKACRPGCTDPDCCGGYWRKFAEMHYAISLDSEDPSNDLTHAEHQLLVNFLGGGPWAQQRAKNLSGKERRDMILDARAAELAQRHGKHRQRFQRRRTPPGFWNEDFPNTQERGREGEEAEVMRREMVRERWREALRDDGVWKFGDE